MRIKPDFDIDKWCIYNEKKFKLELKENAPKDIKKKFKNWQKTYDKPFEEMAKELKELKY